MQNDHQRSQCRMSTETEYARYERGGTAFLGKLLILASSLLLHCLHWVPRLQTNGTIPFIFRAVIEPETVKDAFLTPENLELKYTNPDMPIIVGSTSAEGLEFVAGKYRYSDSI